MIITPTNVPAITFSDLNLFAISDPRELAIDEQAVKNSILLILGTNKGSRLFRRDFGSVLDQYVFDPMDDITVNRIKTEIRLAITKWETRIDLTSVTVVPDYDNSQYFVSMDYTIPALNKTGSFTFNLSQGVSL